LFDAEQNISKKETQEFLRKYMQMYANWVDKILRS
jgi:hypothetical protein